MVIFLARGAISRKTARAAEAGNRGFMSSRFIGETIKPLTETCDFSAAAPGEPCLPREFVWGEKHIEIIEVIRTWRSVGPCRHGSPEMYVRKHWYEVATSEGVMKIYFERQPRRGKTRSSERWWLFSII